MPPRYTSHKKEGVNEVVINPAAPIPPEIEEIIIEPPETPPKTSSEPFKNNKQEILWNLINSLLAGMLALTGSIVNGGLTWKGLGVGFIIGFGVAVYKFKAYWESEQKEYKKNMFTFI